MFGCYPYSLAVKMFYNCHIHKKIEDIVALDAGKVRVLPNAHNHNRLRENSVLLYAVCFVVSKSEQHIH